MHDLRFALNQEVAKERNRLRWQEHEAATREANTQQRTRLSVLNQSEMECTQDLLGGTVVLVIVRKKRRIGRREYSAAFPRQEYILDGSDIFTNEEFKSSYSLYTC